MAYFAHRTAAQRYARGRPFFYPVVAEGIKNVLTLRQPVQRALDVACGTGQSTVVLKDLAAQVVGADISREMLAEAPSAPQINYVAASAEALPFADGAFNLLTVALAFHWFDQSRFLAEARRLLVPDGWLVIYNNLFLRQMAENPDFEAWARGRYPARYPSPPRNDGSFTDADAAEQGFHFVARERYVDDVLLTRDELVRYLTTQSNVIAAVEERLESLGAVEGWLTEALAPLFIAPRGTFRFGGPIWYLRRLGTA